MNSFRKKGLSRYDLAFIFAFIVGILLIFARYHAIKAPTYASGDARAEIVYTVRADSEAQRKALEDADTVTFIDDGKVLGIHKAPPTVTPAKTEVVRKDGTVALLDSSTAYEVRGTLSAVGFLGKHGFFLNGGRHIAVNQTLPVQINGLNVTILVLKIDVFSSN